MPQIQVALLGAGRMGQIHYRNCTFLHKVEVKYVYDPMELSHSSIPSDKRVNSVEKLLADPDIEACIIAAPSAFHVPLIEQCARNRKHVFCEKPISFSVHQLKKVKSIVEQSGIKLQIGFNRRFDRTVAKLKNEIDSGLVGDIHLIHITNRDPKRPSLEFVAHSGGLFYDFNIHDFDMIQYLCDSPIEEIYAMGDALIDPKLKELKDLDTALISIRLQNGALGVIDCSRETGYGYDQRMEIFGSKGLWSMNNRCQTQVGFLGQNGLLRDRIEYSFVERYQESYYLELCHFLECMRADKTPSPNIDDAIASVRAATCALESHQQHRPIPL